MEVNLMEDDLLEGNQSSYICECIHVLQEDQHVLYTSSSETASGCSMIQVTSSCIRDSSPVFGGTSHLHAEEEGEKALISLQHP